MEITRETLISEIVQNAPQAMPVFQSIGMLSLGCPASRGETVEQACAVHGVNVEALLAKINETIGE